MKRLTLLLILGMAASPLASAQQKFTYVDLVKRLTDLGQGIERFYERLEPKIDLGVHETARMDKQNLHIRSPDW